MSYLVVANATAGGADDEAVDAAAAKLREHTTVDVARTASPDELNAALDALEGRTLIVAGGDGSLHLVVDRLRQRGQIAEATLGLIPSAPATTWLGGSASPSSPPRPPRPSPMGAPAFSTCWRTTPVAWWSTPPMPGSAPRPRRPRRA